MPTFVNEHLCLENNDPFQKLVIGVEEILPLSDELYQLSGYNACELVGVHTLVVYVGSEVLAKMGGIPIDLIKKIVTVRVQLLGQTDTGISSEGLGNVTEILKVTDEEDYHG